MAFLTLCLPASSPSLSTSDPSKAPLSLTLKTLAARIPIFLSHCRPVPASTSRSLAGNQQPFAPSLPSPASLSFSLRAARVGRHLWVARFSASLFDQWLPPRSSVGHRAKSPPPLTRPLGTASKSPFFF